MPFVCSAFSFNDLVGITSIIGSIATVIALIVTVLTLRRKTKRLDELNPSLDVLANYKEVWKKVIEIFQEELKGEGAIEIRNIGLDLEKILPDIKDFIDESIKNDPRLVFSYFGVIVNPKSLLIEQMINGASNIKTEYVQSAYRKLQDYQEAFKSHDGIRLEVKSYDLPPVIHGIVINKKHLFLGFTEIDKGKLSGSACPYIYLKYDRKIAATSHYFSVFNKWFDYYWNAG